MTDIDRIDSVWEDEAELDQCVSRIRDTDPVPAHGMYYSEDEPIPETLRSPEPFHGIETEPVAEGES
jgi:hypothetical protein